MALYGVLWHKCMDVYFFLRLEIFFGFCLEKERPGRKERREKKKGGRKEGRKEGPCVRSTLGACSHHGRLQHIH
jgi:hypothetical protein